MRIPSTSELVESQANKAYDKLAVISENLDKLEDIYEFIFNYYAFLKEKLSHYVPNDKDSIIEGVKEFHDEVKFLANTVFPKLVIPSQLESEYKGTITCHYADNDGKVPALVITCGNTEVAKICLGWNTETNKPLLTIPDTDEDVNNSAVTVAYLKSIISNITRDNAKLKDLLERIRTWNFSIENSLNVKTVGNDYTTTEEDFDGNTYIRVDTTEPSANIFVTLPLQEFKGKSLIIRKVAGDHNTLLNIIPSDGVTITPADITPLRRVGSTVTLVYVGDGVYDAFGELT